MQQKEHLKKSPLKIAYVVLGLDISGGVAVILQHANRLRQRGYDVTLLNVGIPVKKIDWFLNEVRIMNVDDVISAGSFDIAIATHYSTVKSVKKMDSPRKIYFVQSDERRFNAGNTVDVVECEMSYREDFEYMTEAIWIQRWLKEEFGHDAYYVPNGLDTKVFYETRPIKAKAKRTRVLLEGPIDVVWKGMDDAYHAIKDLDCEIWIVSSYGLIKSGWRCDKFFYRVLAGKMREIYSSCDIFLKMSRVEGFFGPPMEAMACGCAVVVGKVTGYDEYIKGGYNALVVEQGDVEGAKKAVESIIRDKASKDRLVGNGFETVLNWDWNRSIDLLEKVIKREDAKRYYTETFPEKYDYNQVIKNILLKLVNRCAESSTLKQNDPVGVYDLLKKSSYIIRSEGLSVFTRRVYRFFSNRNKS